MFKPMKDYAKKGLFCEYEYCIEEMPLEEHGESSCPVFGHNCPGGKERVKTCGKTIHNIPKERFAPPEEVEEYLKKYKKDKKEEEVFSDEFTKVILAVEDWKDKLKKEGYLVHFMASSYAYNPKTEEEKDTSMRVFGDKDICYLSLEYLLKKVNDERSNWVDDQKKGGKK